MTDHQTAATLYGALAVACWAAAAISLRWALTPWYQGLQRAPEPGIRSARRWRHG